MRLGKPTCLATSQLAPKCRARADDRNPLMHHCSNAALPAGADISTTLQLLRPDARHLALTAIIVVRPRQLLTPPVSAVDGRSIDSRLPGSVLVELDGAWHDT